MAAEAGTGAKFTRVRQARPKRRPGLANLGDGRAQAAAKLSTRFGPGARGPSAHLPGAAAGGRPEARLQLGRQQRRHKHRLVAHHLGTRVDVCVQVCAGATCACVCTGGARVCGRRGPRNTPIHRNTTQSIPIQYAFEVKATKKTWGASAFPIPPRRARSHLLSKVEGVRGRDAAARAKHLRVWLLSVGRRGQVWEGLRAASAAPRHPLARACGMASGTCSLARAPMTQ